MIHNILYYLTISLILLSFLVGLIKWNTRDKASRIFVIMLGIVFAGEIIAGYFARKYQNNMAVYNILSLIQCLCMALYFKYASQSIGGRNLDIRVGITVVLAGVLMLAFLQPINEMNSYFFVLHGLMVIVMAVILANQLLERVGFGKLFANIHIWLTMANVFFWCCTLLTWIMYRYFETLPESSRELIGLLLLCTNIIVYSTISAAFTVLLPKPDNR